MFEAPPACYLETHGIYQACAKHCCEDSTRQYRAGCFFKGVKHKIVSGSIHLFIHSFEK